MTEKRVPMFRKNVHLSERQMTALEFESHRLQMTQAELVRRILDAYFCQTAGERSRSVLRREK